MKSKGAIEEKLEENKVLRDRMRQRLTEVSYGGVDDDFQREMMILDSLGRIETEIKILEWVLNGEEK